MESRGESPRVTAARIEVGKDMEVIGSDGGRVGRVKETRLSDFLVDRRLALDVYVPMEAVQRVAGDRVMLNVPADRVGDMGWATTDGGAPLPHPVDPVDNYEERLDRAPKGSRSVVTGEVESDIPPRRP